MDEQERLQRFRDAERLHSERLRTAGQRFADLQRQSQAAFDAIRFAADAQRTERTRAARAAWRDATRELRDVREDTERAAAVEYHATIDAPLAALERLNAKTWEAYNRACEAAYAEYEAAIR